MRMLETCAGIGGMSLAAHWVGIQTAAFCEINPFPQRVLRKNFPGVPIIPDIRDVTKKNLEEVGAIGNGRTIRIMASGYPCQGESYAGERKGEEDDRWIWPEHARILEEIQPDWFVGENVSGHITLGLDTVLTDLGRIGYTAQPFHIPALAVDADHERYRVFVVAHANKKSGLQARKALSAIREKWDPRENAGWGDWRPLPRADWVVSGPPVSRDIDGIPDRVDRCHALGNAVSPYQAYPVFKCIKAVDDLLQVI